MRKNYHNKEYYIGDLVNDKKEGKGKLFICIGVQYYSNNEIKYCGEWKDDMMHGRGNSHVYYWKI